ncbi:MAG: hypothetical protein ACTSV7_11835 [Candidatus Baldrarchaeia archaeon]
MFGEKRELIIPTAPLPLLRHLLTAINMKDNRLGRTWCNTNKKIYFFSRCAWGIAEAIEAILKTRKRSEGIVFLPDYFCNEALIPLRRKSLQMVFYRITGAKPQLVTDGKFGLEIWTSRHIYLGTLFWFS